MKDIIGTLFVFVSCSSISVWVFQKEYVYLNGTLYSKDSNPVVFYFWVIFMAGLAVFSVIRFYVMRSHE